jgi:hypothetical protein
MGELLAHNLYGGTKYDISYKLSDILGDDGLNIRSRLKNYNAIKLVNWMNKKLGYRIPVCCANGSRCHCLSLHTNARSRG